MHDGIITHVYEDTPAATADVRMQYGIVGINDRETLSLPHEELAALLDAQVCTDPQRSSLFAYSHYSHV